MAEKKETAEQKLLKIIETQGGAQTPTASPKDAQAAAQIASAVRSSGLPPISLDSVFGPLLAFFKGPSTGISFGIREINNFLLGFVILLGILFVLNMFSGMRMLKEKKNFNVSAQAVKHEDSFIPQLKEVSDYISEIGQRNIFQPYEKKVVETAAATELETKKVGALAKNFKLVGISWLDSPSTASVMIEDTESGNTYFLKVGEKINGVTIKDIYADRVILTYDGEDAVIKL